MNGKFDNNDKQDLLKRGFSEDNISYLESLDSDDKKPLYLKIIEVMDNNGITTEQIMEKVKGVVQNITNKPELEPEVVKEKEEETVVPETEVVEEVVTSEPEVVEEVVTSEPEVVDEVVTPETEVVEEEKVVTEEGGKKTLKNRNKKKYKKSRKGKNSRKGRKSRKGYKPTKNKKSKHHK